MMPAQLHGVAERGDKHLAVRTGPEMSSKFGTDVFGQLVVDIGRQLSENVEASAFPGLVTMWNVGWLLLLPGFFSGHEPLSLGRQVFCDR